MAGGGVGRGGAGARGSGAGSVAMVAASAVAVASAGAAAVILFILVGLVGCILVAVLALMVAVVREGRRELEEAAVSFGPDVTPVDGDE